MGVIAFATRKPAVPVVGSNLFTFGRNNSGQLMQGNTTDYSSPVQVGALGTWEDIAGGQHHVALTQSDGTLWTAGENIYGQLGLGIQGAAHSSPEQVGSLTDWESVSCSHSSSYAIKTDGTMWSWGYNVNGMLGIGTQGTAQHQSSPTQIGALTTWNKIDAGEATVHAIRDDGTLWSWGNGIYGGLGTFSTTSRSSPTQVASGTLWSEVSAGRYHGLGIKTDGTLWSWGYNVYGQLGLTNTIDRSSPMAVGALTTWAKVAAGSYFSAAIKTDGTLWTWGSNQYGQIGQGNPGNTAHRSSPVQVGAETNWLAVSAWEQVVAVKTDGTLWAWGRNQYGQGDQGDIAPRSSPTQVGALTDWDGVAAGEVFTLALR